MNATEIDIPRIADVSTDSAPYVLVIRWEGGTVDRIDVSSLIDRFRVYAPLRQSRALFDRVHAGEFGTDVCWTAEIDMAANTLWNLAQEQKPAASARSSPTRLAVN